MGEIKEIKIGFLNERENKEGSIQRSQGGTYIWKERETTFMFHEENHIRDLA